MLVYEFTKQVLICLTAQNPLLGLDLGKYLKETVKFRYNFSVGVSERASSKV